MQRSLIKGSDKQCGAALILMLLVSILAVLSIFVINHRFYRGSLEHDAQGLRSLYQAKQLLLAYAARPHGRESDNALERRELQLSRLGELPCPDADNSGQSTFPNFDYLGANCRYQAGWFAWESFDSSDLSESTSGVIWFAVAEGFANRSGLGGYNEPVINYLSPVTMRLDHRPVVAVLIYSGQAFASQTQRHVNDAAIAQTSFFEAENADGNNNEFVSHSTIDEFNDIAIGISLDELLIAVEKQAVNAIARRLNQYFVDNGEYPAPSSTGQLCDTPRLPAQGDIPKQCAGVASTAPSLPFPQSTAEDASDVWVVRNEWLPLFNYTRIANDHIRLSSRTLSSRMHPIEFVAGVQTR